MNHWPESKSVSKLNSIKKLSECFSNDEGCRLLSAAINDECKLLQEIKKLLEKRISLDEQYVKGLQELATSTNRLKWPANTHSVVSVSQEVFSQWAQLSTTMSTNIQEFKRIVFDDIIKTFLDYKNDSRKFLEDEKRRYDMEHRKAEIDVAESAKRYSDEAKSYAAKNNELTKLQNNTCKSDDARIKTLKESVIDKRGNVYRAHNDYVFKVREYNFVDEEYVSKINNLLVYHEESQAFINKSWQIILESVAKYLIYRPSESTATLRQAIASLDPRHFYDELCRIHSNLTKVTVKPQLFDEMLLKASDLTKLKANEFIADTSTKQDLIQKIQKLTANINDPIPKILHFSRDKQNSYYDRKDLFEQNRTVSSVRLRKQWEEKLQRELKSIVEDAGYRLDDQSMNDSDEELADQLEDQPYFHGVIPRNQVTNYLREKGDYLVRRNDDGKLVLSIVWTDPTEPSKLRDGHFFIVEQDRMYSFMSNPYSKPSVHELLAFFKRQKLQLRDDGTRLIRAVPRPAFVINNDEVRILEPIGRGHFGQVVRGEYRGRPVAVKILHQSSTGTSAKNRQDFINEALLLQQYKHKNIVDFIGIAAICDPLMIIMELVEQGSLNKFVKINDLRVPQMIQMCYDIVKGMAYLEQNHVIHRDLAARNCLVDKKNRIKVADFGLSRCLQSDEEYICQIKEIPIRWWAIEIFSDAPYTNKSDVWSYGVTIWEVFSKADLPYGHLPQNNLVLEAIRRGERLKQPEKCPAKIYSIMTSCWAVDPKDRPSFEKLVELLKKEKPLFS